ncbi:MAG TPA: hypothetical protein VF199_07855 [Bacillales bacterium]
MRMKSRRFSLSVLFTAMVFVLAACGDGGSATSDGGQKSVEAADQENGRSMAGNSNDDTAQKEKESAVDHILKVTAHDFAFNKEKFVAKSGEITVHFKSVEGTHGFAIYKSEGSTEKLLNITGKGTKTVNLKPGKYYIPCSVVCGGGHGHMDAVLIVKG